MSKKKIVDSVESGLDVETGEVVSTPVDVMNYPVYPWSTKYNYDPQLQRLKVEGPSMTVPGQSLPMSEILNRYQAGRPLSMSVTEYGGYDLENELPDLRKLDISEIHDLKLANDAKLAEIRAEMVTKEKQLKDLAEANAKEKWFNEEIKKRGFKKLAEPGSEE